MTLQAPIHNCESGTRNSLLQYKNSVRCFKNWQDMSDVVLF